MGGFVVNKINKTQIINTIKKYFHISNSLIKSMKLSKTVSSSRRKNRKAHFNATSRKLSKMMTSPLDSDLKKKYAVNAMPIRVDDEVRILRGWFRHREGKVISVNRKKGVITVERVSIEKTNGQK